MGRPKSISDEDLLAVARVEFLRQGAFGSTKEIARKAGISEAALFKRYPTKAQLFLAALVPPTPGIEPVLERALAARTAKTGVQLVAEAVLDYFRVAIPMILPLITQREFGDTHLPRNFQTNPATSLLAAVSRYYREEISRGRLGTPSPDAAAAALVSAMHSVVLFEIMGFHGGTMPRTAIRAMVDSLWDGLEPKENRKRSRKTDG
ncbi:MAG: TetR/AcrR family transcriptional regulator [Micropepsaceae bacterium]